MGEDGTGAEVGKENLLRHILGVTAVFQIRKGQTLHAAAVQRHRLLQICFVSCVQCPHRLSNCITPEWGEILHRMEIFFPGKKPPP